MGHTDGIADNSLNGWINTHTNQITNRGTGFAPLATNDQDNGNVAIIEDDGTLYYTDGAGTLQLDWIAVIEKFYATHNDIYDFVGFFSAVLIGSGSSFKLVHNTTTGLQIDIEDNRDTLANHATLAGAFHSPTGEIHNLKCMTRYNDLTRLPVNPNQLLAGNNDNTLSLIAQEIGHYWGMASQFQPAGGPPNSNLLQGRAQSHWSFFAHTNFSSLEGCNWVNNGTTPASWTSTGQTNGYANVDLYLMGMINATTLLNLFYIQNPVITNPAGGAFTSSSTPIAGVTVQGTQVNVTTAQIIAALGTRVPSFTTSQKTFNMAFILIVPNGWTLPAQATQLTNAVAQVQGYATAWATYWNNSTASVGTMNIALNAARLTDLYIRDNLTDDGTEPSTGGLSQSPDILIKKNILANPTTTFGASNNSPVSDPVEIGNTNYIYLRVFNRGNFPADASASVYFAPLSTSVSPTNWTLIGELDIPLTMVNDFSITGPLDWPSVPDPGSSGHFCLIAILDNPLDPAPDTSTIVDTSTFLDTMRASNNIAYRNVTFEDVLADSDSDADFSLGSFEKSDFFRFVFDGTNIPKGWYAKIRLPKKILRQKKIKVKGFKKSKGELLLEGNKKGIIQDVYLPARSNSEVHLQIKTDKKSRYGQLAEFQVAQFKGKRQAGQVNFQVRIVDRKKVPLLGVKRTKLYYPANHKMVVKLPNRYLKPIFDIDQARAAGFDPGFGLPNHHLGPATISHRLQDVILRFVNGAKTKKEIIDHINRKNIPTKIPKDLSQFLGFTKSGFSSSTATGLVVERKRLGAYRTIEEVWTSPGMTPSSFYLLAESAKGEFSNAKKSTMPKQNVKKIKKRFLKRRIKSKIKKKITKKRRR